MLVRNDTTAAEACEGPAYGLGVGVGAGVFVGGGIGWQLFKFVLATPSQFSPGLQSLWVLQILRHWFPSPETFVHTLPVEQSLVLPGVQPPPPPPHPTTATAAAKSAIADNARSRLIVAPPFTCPLTIRGPGPE